MFEDELRDAPGGPCRVQHHVAVGGLVEDEPDLAAVHLRHRDIRKGARPPPCRSPSTRTASRRAPLAASSSTVPLATSRPWSMMATDSHRSSTWSSWWLENSTQRPE